MSYRWPARAVGACRMLARAGFHDRRSRGQALVELAIITPILLLLLLGAIDLGRVFYAQMTVNDAAREGALEATRNPTSFLSGTACTSANKDANRVMCRTTNEARGSFVTVAPSDVEVTCSTSPCPASPALGDTVTVRVTGHFTPVTPLIASFMGGSQVTFASSATAQLNAAPSTPTGAPVANFTATPASGPAPLSVTLTDASTGSPTTWTWDFGDGQSSAARGPHTHVYASEGVYTVRLTVSNAGGTTFTTRTVTVSAATLAPPVADFTVTPATGAAPLPVAFADLSTGAPTDWLWTFGDGATSTSPSPGTHTYASAGTFTVTLQVTNSAGTDTATRTVTTTASCAAPVASFTVSPTSGRKNSTLFDVTDTSTNMTTAGCNNVWSWDFGDGAGSSLTDPPNHVYDKRGTYTIQLTVSNLGGSDMTTRTVTVSN